MNNKGMTLVELLAVIVIIAILALISTPAIGNIIANSQSKSILTDANTVIAAAKLAMVDGSCTSMSICKSVELQPYVEDQKGKLAATDTVTKDSNGVYIITYAKFSTLKPGKVTDEFKKLSVGGGGKSITSINLAKVMGN